MASVVGRRTALGCRRWRRHGIGRRSGSHRWGVLPLPGRRGAGRLPDPARPRELLVGREAARQFDLEPGTILEIDFLAPEDLLPLFGTLLTGLPDRLAGRDQQVVDLFGGTDPLTVRFTIVGIG